MKKIILKSSIILIINFLFISSVYAGVRIDKPKVRLSIAPGSYDSGEIKVENTEKSPITIKVYLEDWVYNQQDGGKEFMPKGTTVLSCSDWITFYPTDFTVPAGEAQAVRYTVTVPEGAKGGHYSVMFFETAGEDINDVNEKGGNVLVKVLNRLGALFYVEPEGTVEKTAEIKNLNLDLKLNDFTVTADLVNIGNTDIVASGTFDVIDSAGVVYLRGEFKDAYALPKDKVVLEATAQSASLQAGSYDLLLTIEFENGGMLVKEASFNVSAEGAISAITLKE